ncbi:Uncharacterised protein [Metamycoplasma arthritidis]|uniref:Hypothetical lipoprotein n=1 Tax=Metamycoplasma arthritidis (strain 158L3-1) TaxID=243272 RepID=B3PLW8_META1|nr:hypothetical protein [Metamycoplasma arthritidis]ACF07020.1 hypothetical lipoprotein [Metamycoplasma arthritidis 158L3-1]VEU78548.1 Uncharacterised protein [Metamycoplasma arthritidis]
MKKIVKLITLSATSVTTFLMPIVLTSCTREDYEDQSKIGTLPETKKKTYEISSPLAKEIQALYEGDITKLFIDGKENFRRYSADWAPLVRNLSLLRARLNELAAQQTIVENRQALEEFIKNWFSTKVSDLSKYKLAYYLYKYALIFNDANAVLKGINLQFESNQFLENLAIVDDRLNGKDINIARLQNALKSLWEFVKHHIIDLQRITKKEDLPNINLEDDSNAHNHSHAVVNLTNELGLWHNEMLAWKNELDHLKTDFEAAQPHIVENINHITLKDAFEQLIKTFQKATSPSSDYNLLDASFQTRGKAILEKLKGFLIQIAKDNGIADAIDFEI